MKVTVFKNINNPKDGSVVDIEKIFDGIRTSEKIKETVLKISKLNSKSERDALKITLPVITFNGEFSYRSKDGFEKHNGLMIVDIDDIKESEMSRVRSQIEKLPYTFACFLSPSYNGFKFLVRIPEINVEELGKAEADFVFKEYFNGLCNDLIGITPDPSGKDTSRACFMSYDPDIYVNYDAVVFSERVSVERPRNYQEKIEIPKIEKSADWALRIISDKVVAAIDGQRHHELYSASRLAGGYIAGGVLEQHEAEETLAAAFNQRAFDKNYKYRKTISDGIKDGLHYPIYDRYKEPNEIIGDFKSNIDVSEFTEKDELEKYIYSWDKIDQELEDWFDGKIALGESTGVQQFDNWFKFKRNSLYLCTGKLGRGKTTIQQFLFTMSSVVNDWKWLIVAMENSKMDFAENLISFHLKEDAKEVRRYDKERFLKAKKFVKEHYKFIISEVNNIDDLLNMARAYHKHYPFDAMFIDPVNSVSPKAGFDWDFSSGVGAASKVLRFREEVASVFISQHPIMSKQRDSGTPSSADGEGGYFANKADFAFVLERQSGSNTTYMKIDKVRNRKTGGAETDPEFPIELMFKGATITMNVPVLKDGAMRYEYVAETIPNRFSKAQEKQTEIDIFDINPEDAF